VPEPPSGGVTVCLHTVYLPAKLDSLSETRLTQALDIVRSRLLLAMGLAEDT